MDTDANPINDLWILDIDQMEWRQVSTSTGMSALTYHLVPWFIVISKRLLRNLNSRALLFHKLYFPHQFLKILRYKDLKLLLYPFWNICLTTSPSLKTPRKIFFTLLHCKYMYLALVGKIHRCTCKNSQFTQHIMHKNEAHEFLYTRITKRLL